MAALHLVMYFQVFLLFWSINGPFLIAEAKKPLSIAKSGCQPSCGNVSIPYPFGMEAPCYLNKSFEISCNSTTGVPTLSIDGTNLEVINISVQYTTITVNFPVVFQNCEGQSRSQVVDLEGNPFAFSRWNYFFAWSCGSYALLIQNQSAVGGCLSTCNTSDTEMNRSFSGTNCCLTKILPYLKVFNVSFEFKSGCQGNSQTGEVCRYAYLQDERYPLNDSYRGNNTFDFLKARNYHLPVVLDWWMEIDVFKSLVKKRLFDNSSKTSMCTEKPLKDIGIKGKKPPKKLANQITIVQCSCAKGYEGNPYLTGICQGDGAPRNDKGIIAGLAVGVASGAVIILAIEIQSLYEVFKIRRIAILKKNNFRRNGGLLLQKQLSSDGATAEKIKMFPSKELDKATDCYNVDRLLGQGGQSTVYRGMLADGKDVAVKKSGGLDESQQKQFIDEVVLLSRINHTNVVKVLGCCLETEVPLLVYEFIPNGTLYQFLHDPNKKILLTWKMRLRIATEVAGALFHLHSAFPDPIFHRNVKSTNILLDKIYRAKVADFGFARSVTIDQTDVTTQVQDTFGYLDPECCQSSQFTDKSDVYSFGIVLVELLTGQKAISSERPEEDRGLATYFLKALEGNRLFDILDTQVKEGKQEDIMMVADLAGSCLRLNGNERPTMEEVTMVLQGKLEDLTDQQENEYDRNDVIGAFLDIASTLTDLF